MKKSLLILALAAITNGAFVNLIFAQPTLQSLQEQILDIQNRLSLLEESMRQIADKSDVGLQSKESEKNEIAILDKRILQLETDLRLLKDSKSTVNTTTAITSVKSATEDNNNGFDSGYLNLFDSKDASMDELALFSKAYGLYNEKNYKKSRAYLEKFRINYPTSKYYPTSLYLSGISSYSMKDYKVCSDFLGEYLPVSSPGNLDQTNWTYANCLYNQGKSSNAKDLLSKLAKDKTSRYQTQAAELLKKIK